MNSAKKLQLMDEDLLYEQAAQRLRVMILHGTTAVEIKSGYGLTVEAELKMLRVILLQIQSFQKSLNFFVLQGTVRFARHAIQRKGEQCRVLPALPS